MGFTSCLSAAFVSFSALCVIFRLRHLFCSAQIFPCVCSLVLRVFRLLLSVSLYFLHFDMVGSRGDYDRVLRKDLFVVVNLYFVVVFANVSFRASSLVSVYFLFVVLVAYHM